MKPILQIMAIWFAMQMLAVPESLAGDRNTTWQTPGPEETATLAADLNSPDPRKRKMATIRFAMLAPVPARQKEIAKLLEARLADGDTTMKAAAATALGSWGNADCLPALHQALKYQDLSVRVAAIDSLAKLANPKSIEPLAALIGEADSRLRNDLDHADNALKAYGPLAEDAILKLLENGKPMAIYHACRILQSIGTANSQEPLARLMKDTDKRVAGDANRAWQAISHRTKAADPAAQTVPAKPAGPATPHAKTGHTTLSDAEIAAILAELNSGDRIKAVSATAKFIAKPPAAPNRTVAEALTKAMLENHDTAVRMNAINALGSWGDATDLPALNKMLGDPKRVFQMAAKQSIDKIKNRKNPGGGL